MVRWVLNRLVESTNAHADPHTHTHSNSHTYGSAVSSFFKCHELNGDVKFDYLIIVDAKSVRETSVKLEGRYGKLEYPTHTHAPTAEAPNTNAHPHRISSNGAKIHTHGPLVTWLVLMLRLVLVMLRAVLNTRLRLVILLTWLLIVLLIMLRLLVMLLLLL